MPTIRIRDETWERLKKHAVPFEDTPDLVINRLLDEFEEKRFQTQTGGGSKMYNTTFAKRERRGDTTAFLRNAGTILAGTRIGVILDKLPHGADPEDPRFTARFARDVKNVIWDHDGQEHSISELARTLGERFGVIANAESENGNRVFGLLSNRSKCLEQLRMEMEGRR